jgi:integrase
MSARLTDKTVAKLPLPSAGNRIHYDSEVSGLGCRVTAAAARSFILEYRTRSGRKRRYTIGRVGEWSVGAARTEARELKKQIDRGEDPLADIRADREAPTVADLCERFSEEHLPKKRASTQQGYRTIIDGLILPKLRHMKVAEVTFADVDALHRRVTKGGAPYQANRAVAVLSKMFSLAMRWTWRPDNPAKGVERNQESKRERYLSADELKRLSEALTDCADQQGANIIRLLLLTGARRGEVFRMRWADLDLKVGIWTKPGATTKQATFHRVPLSAPARALLADLRRKADDDDAEFVFPSRVGGHRVDIKKTWIALCKATKITGANVHDLRHTYASVLASSGHSLPVIGRLLGHTQPVTTARYSHLQDDPLRLATERAGAILSGKSSAQIVPIKSSR